MNQQQCKLAGNRAYVECESCDGFDKTCEFYEDNI